MKEEEAGPAGRDGRRLPTRPRRWNNSGSLAAVHARLIITGQQSFSSSYAASAAAMATGLFLVSTGTFIRLLT